MADTVRIDGLADLRRDLRAMQPEARKEVTRALKQGAQVVAVAAVPFTARKTGAMAKGWRAGAAGNSAFVRNRHPGAGVQEHGGVIRPKGVPITIKPHPAATRALDLRADSIVEKVGDALDDVFVRAGFR